MTFDADLERAQREDSPRSSDFTASIVRLAVATV